jgi:hypothetical protein
MTQMNNTVPSSILDIPESERWDCDNDTADAGMAIADIGCPLGELNECRSPECSLFIILEVEVVLEALLEFDDDGAVGFCDGAACVLMCTGNGCSGTGCGRVRECSPGDDPLLTETDRTRIGLSRSMGLLLVAVIVESTVVAPSGSICMTDSKFGM